MGLRHWLRGSDDVEFAAEQQITALTPAQGRGGWSPLTLDAAEGYRRAGVSWPGIVRLVPGHRRPGTGPLGPQVGECLHYLCMRAYCSAEDELAAVRCAAAVLLAPPDADAYVRLLGIRPLIPEELEQ